MSELPVPSIQVPELTLVCGVPKAGGRPHHLSLEVLLLIEGKVVEVGKPGHARTPSSWEELAEFLVGGGHVQDGVTYRIGHCPKHGRVGILESDVKAGFERGDRFAHAQKIGRPV